MTLHTAEPLVVDEPHLRAARSLYVRQQQAESRAKKTYLVEAAPHTLRQHIAATLVTWVFNEAASTKMHSSTSVRGSALGEGAVLAPLGRECGLQVGALHAQICEFGEGLGPI